MIKNLIKWVKLKRDEAKFRRIEAEVHRIIFPKYRYEEKNVTGDGWHTISKDRYDLANPMYGEEFVRRIVK
jgi:hypothetical protein